MDVFEVHQQLVADYKAFTSGFTEIRDERIRRHVERRLEDGDQWPDPFISLNPNFKSGGTIDALVEQGVLTAECARIFRIGKVAGTQVTGKPLDLHRHQREAIEVATRGLSYVLTTGTGSGKSLAYIVPIVDRIVRQHLAGTYSPGVKAIIVYPMNALANSQFLELEKFLKRGYPAGGEPVTFRRYTGQDSDADRKDILANPPDILLTNYVMLELLLTRPDERKRLITAATGLQFLVLDELHTYRGRQGADVAMLVRRLRDASGAEGLQCVGTSATMTTEVAERGKREVARVASRIFGVPVLEHEGVIIETLTRVTTGDENDHAAIGRRVAGVFGEVPYDEFVKDPLAAWVETHFGVRVNPANGDLVRPQAPSTLADAAQQLAGETGQLVDRCKEVIQDVLQLGARLTAPRTQRPVFAFRLHQFLSKGDNVFLSIEPVETRHITNRYQITVPKADGSPSDRLLMPAAFCRECGQEYLSALQESADGQVRYLPRRLGDPVSDDAASGYLYISSAQPWPESLDAGCVTSRTSRSACRSCGNKHRRAQRDCSLPTMTATCANSASTIRCSNLRGRSPVWSSSRQRGPACPRHSTPSCLDSLSAIHRRTSGQRCRSVCWPPPERRTTPMTSPAPWAGPVSASSW
jgi:hypothetical protein